jgi:hypothetical protein
LRTMGTENAAPSGEILENQSIAISNPLELKHFIAITDTETLLKIH